MLFFDEMSKERKIQKDKNKKQSEKEWEKKQKYGAFLDAIEKYKKQTKVQGVFFGFCF